MEDFSSDLNRENLEEFLSEDPTFVDYFNTFLSLPCFPERMFYNKDLDLLEQFSQKLAKDENDKVQIRSRPLKHWSQRTKDHPSIATVCIGYCVTILDRNSGFEWVKEYRLPEFLKSNLYAEYKLSKVLAAAQALYSNAIKEDVYREKECDLKSTRKVLERSIRSSPVSGFAKQRGTCSGKRAESPQVPWTDFTESASPMRLTFDNTRCEAKQNRALQPIFKASDTEYVSSVGELSDECDDFEGKTRKNREYAMQEIVDTASHDDLFSDVARNDAIGSDVTISDAMRSDVAASDVIGNDFTNNHVRGSGVEANDINSSDVVDSGAKVSALIESDFMAAADVVILGNSSTHDEVVDYSSDVITVEFPNKTMLSFARNYPNTSVNTSNGFPSDAATCELDEEVKISRIFTDKTENCVVGNTKEGIEETFEKSGEDISECVQTGALDIFHGNVVVNTSEETMNTFQGIHKDGEYCRCFSEHGQMSKAGKFEGDTFPCESPKVDVAKRAENDVNSEDIKYDKRLEGIKGEKDDLEEKSTMREPRDDDTYERDYDTILLRTELGEKEREMTMDCRDSSSLITGTKAVEDDVDIRTQSPDYKHDNLSEKIEQNSQLDVGLSDMDEMSFVIHKQVTTDYESENCSTSDGVTSLNSISSEGVLVEEDVEKTLKPHGEVDRHFDLSTKQGMDELKNFLAGTKGETLFSFWLQMELWKSVEGEGEKTKAIQNIKDMFLRNGSPLELPHAVKRHVKIFAEDLSGAQRIIAHPLLTYWCPRFTLHQLKTSTFAALKNQIVASDSCQHVTAMAQSEVEPNRSSSPHLNTNPRLVRPHSSTPRMTETRERKTRVRSKSAFPRIITTPCHTNAGKKQLELYAASPPTQYGYQKRPVEAFPPPSDQDYLSPVRLVINPLARPSPRSRSAWTQRSEEKRQSSQPSSEESANNFFHPEFLVDALMYNSETGCFFKKFLNKQNNKLWLNCLSFWHSLMEYSAYFDGDTLNPVLVTKKAQWIYARFIATGSLCDIQLEWKKQAEVRQKLEPAYEDIFDVVEEHILSCLKEPWESLCHNERREYDMVPKKETVRYLEVDLKKTRDRRTSFGDVAELESYENGERDRGKYSIEEANHPLPAAKDGVGFESIIKDGAELEGFQKFLEKKDPNGVMDLMAWTDMETFQRIPRTMQDKRNKKAKEIRHGYLNSKFFFGSDSPATKEAQNLILSMNGSSRFKDRPSTSLISECQKYVRCRIERRWLTLYKESQEYRDRQIPKHNVSEVVEDIMLRRRLQRSEAAWRVLNSRWVSSSRDIVALRHTLNKPESCLVFRKFVALKGDTYENDVLFWIEVQKYKDLCHRHASDKCIKKKIQAITDCFLTSLIPPELQIDVPIEMAEKLMERITSRNSNIGPYLFREVQMTVFRVLFNMWKEFCSFRSTIKDGNVLEVLEKKMQQHRNEMKQKREASERKKLAKQEAERKRKEKEEKERKELKSVEQLVSLMTETDPWGQEEEDVVLWRYSKHVTGNETVKKKTSTQEETLSLIAPTNQRSQATKSTNNITSSMRGKRNAGKDYLAVSESSKLVRGCGSTITESLYSNRSKGSQKNRKSANLLIPKIKHTGSKLRSPNEVAMEKSTGKEKTAVSRSKEGSPSERFTSLQNRHQKEIRESTDSEISNFVRKESLGKSTMRIKGTTGNCGPKSPRVNNSTIKARNRSPVSLTSELLKDFTNSPEGAPLETPLSLVRNNESQSLNCNRSSLSFLQETKQKTLTRAASIRNQRTGLRYERETIRKDRQLDFIADVIVN